MKLTRQTHIERIGLPSNTAGFVTAHSASRGKPPKPQPPAEEPEDFEKFGTIQTTTNVSTSKKNTQQFSKNSQKAQPRELRRDPSAPAQSCKKKPAPVASEAIGPGDHAKPKRVETQIYLGTHLVKIVLSKLHQHDSNVSLPSLSQACIGGCEALTNEPKWATVPQSLRLTAVPKYKGRFVFGPKKLAFDTYSSSKQEDRPSPQAKPVGLIEKAFKTNSEQLVKKPKWRQIGKSNQFHSTKAVNDLDMKLTSSTIFDNIPNISIPMHGHRRLSQIVDTIGIL